VGGDAHFDDPGLAGRGQRHAGLQGCNGGGECGSFGLILANGWEIVRHDARLLITGPESFWSVNAPASQVKKATILLEESHPLGRLWDIDVFCPENGLLSRKSVGENKRRCFICDEPAHVCSRMRRHSLHSLQTVMEARINDYFCHQK
jgi:holo-ACP synthase